MSLVKQIENKSAVSAWSPLSEYSNLIALGTKDSSGTGFDDHGGELEIHSMDICNTDLTTKVLGSVKASSRFSSLAWSPMLNFHTSFNHGLIAGGMVDGVVNVWDPKGVVEHSEDALRVSLEQHQGAVTALHFNPHKESSHLLATGGSDGDVFVVSLDRLEAPSVFIPANPPNTTKHTADVTSVSWNSQVAHIMASASQNGSCFVWDLRQKRAWCELRDPSGGPVSDLAWNPEAGLHIITASGDDKNPVLKLWDLRSSTSLPLATMNGHNAGILSISWCPFDTSLLLSCGKDSKTIVWDLFHLQPIYELPFIQPHSEGNDPSLFNPLVSSASQRRHHVAWSPCLPTVVSTASFDRRLQFYSLSGMQSKTGRAPKWMRRPVTCAFGFGGKLVSIENSVSAVSTRKGSSHSKIHVYQISENVDIINESDEFHAFFAAGKFKELCEAKTNLPSGSVWKLMRVICFGDNAREELLSYLGFDSSLIRFPESSVASTALGDGGYDKSQFEKILHNIRAAESAEPTIRKALIVGNFEMAVECCLQSGLFAEALLLAQCGGPELKAKTQAQFFERQSQEQSFLRILHSVIKGQLMEYVAASNLNNWKETLALLSTYGKSDEFPALCEALANRLELESKDRESAALCYMCAANVERTIAYWTEELNLANEREGRLDIQALQDYVEKVLVFTHANPVLDFGLDCGAFFAEYGNLLASQGRLSTATNYLKGNALPIRILQDRIYHSGSKPAGSKPPPFPFSRTEIDDSKPQHNPTKADEQGTVQESVSNPVPSVAESFPPLLPGWVQLFDQSSQRFYYANQITGKSQWELPTLSVPASSTKVEPVQKPAQIAFDSSLAPSQLEPVIENATPKEIPSAVFEADCVIAIGQMIEAIAAGPLNVTEKKQIGMLRSNYQILSEKMKKAELNQDILQKLSSLVDSLCSRNYPTANAIQTELVNTEWNQHKEWLKGIKILIQLASKK